MGTLRGFVERLDGVTGEKGQKNGYTRQFSAIIRVD